ncbi:hypothetical protein NW762_006339 [Fusarium torreyae]|uniref:Metallo-beta-lactamase domain-containing protein n=1 Tax=Fusarium torreyae TaxID=1237075 RepID=A0A9W8S3A3_9HYPO|nr:hypothetical protein NW762_006339 [Fusarium torreyae]
MAPSTFNSNVFITHITTATAIVEIDGVRFITDPIFDDAMPKKYDAAPLLPQATGPVLMERSEGPAIDIKQLPFIQGVLLSHEDHFDNLDETGRQLLISRPVFTTPDGKRNLSEYPEVKALQAWKTLTHRWEGEQWSITGVPCVHLPGGEVTGFVLHKETFGYQPDGRPNVFYFTGDTILLPDVVSKLRERFHVVVALMNLGNAHAPYPDEKATPQQITMSGEDAAKMFRGLGADVLVPMHYDHWTHFTEGEESLRETFEKHGIIDQVAWLSSGKQVMIV